MLSLHHLANLLIPAPITLMLLSVPLVLKRAPKAPGFGPQPRHAHPATGAGPYAATQKTGLTLLYAGLALVAVLLFLARL